MGLAIWRLFRGIIQRAIVDLNAWACPPLSAHEEQKHVVVCVYNTLYLFTIPAKLLVICHRVADVKVQLRVRLLPKSIIVVCRLYYVEKVYVIFDNVTTVGLLSLSAQNYSRLQELRRTVMVDSGLLLVVCTVNR